MDAFEKTCAGLGVVVIFLLVSAVATVSHPTQIEYYEVYKATVPFGEFISSGELGGFMFFGFGGVSGSLSGDEYYLVKYFDGEELKTLKLDAEDTPLIVDGTLRLEVISEPTIIRWFFIFKTVSEDMFPDYRIHIPYLPEVNQTMREDWTK